MDHLVKASFTSKFSPGNQEQYDEEAIDPFFKEDETIEQLYSSPNRDDYSSFKDIDIVDQQADVDDVSSQSSQGYSFDDNHQQEEQQRLSIDLEQGINNGNVELLATPSKIREVAKVESQVPYTESFLKRSDLEHCESKVLMIPPPMSFQPRPAAASAYEEDTDKTKFMRFLKMVERKNEATANRQQTLLIPG